MLTQHSRTEIIFGADAMAKLFNSKVAVFGVGGVGGYVVEAFARSGIGKIDLFDYDKVCITNLNRQIHATRKTLGLYKVDVAKERIHDINPDAEVGAYKMFYLPDTSDQIDLSRYDYIVDAIDTVAGKIELVVKANECNVPVISSMGAGNKVNAADFQVADIYETSICPLAKVMRQELRKRNVPKLKVVFSKEQGLKRQIPGSTAFVPGTVGLIIAGEVIKDLIGFAELQHDSLTY
jgi:tRNA A37 threonylcarbamoyladenosine dehydratase